MGRGFTPKTAQRRTGEKFALFQDFSFEWIFKSAMQMSELSSQRTTQLPPESGFDTDAPTVRRLIDGDEGSASGVGSSRVESAQTVIRKSGSILPPPPSEQATPAEVAKVLEGAELGNFRLECLIGGGGMGDMGGMGF